MAIERDPHSRRCFARILGLPESAADSELRSAADRLLGALRRRREELRLDLGSNRSDEPDTRGNAHRALTAEIEELDASAVRWLGPRTGAIQRGSRVDRYSLSGALLGSAVMLALLIAYAGGFRVVRLESEYLSSTLEEPAELVLVGHLPGATLRVLDADREETLVETAAEGALVELVKGRYALEVSREGCPDHWTRSVYLEAGTVHRFEPSLCVGEGQLRVDSNVEKDRLLIDGFDVGSPGAKTHTLSVGDHWIRVEKAGYLPFESRIRIKPDSDLQLRAELVSEEDPRPGLRADFPLAFETIRLQTEALPEPEPFDLRSLKEDLTPRKAGASRTRLLARGALDDSPDGGSTAWHDRVSGELLGRFDGDGSGSIDRLEESDSIGCPLWREIERDFERGGLGLSMARYYGFDGTEWHRKALGFAQRMRSAAYAKMKECGLQQ